MERCAIRHDKASNVLPVDDESIILAGGLPVLRETLPSANVFGFTKPMQAVDFVKKNPVAMAFLDIEPGRASGLDLCRELLRIRPRTNVIYLTAFREYSFDAWATGACGFHRHRSGGDDPVRGGIGAHKSISCGGTGAL